MTAVAAQPVQKERVRGLYLRVLVSKAQGVSFERALVLAEGANGVIASSKRLDEALVGGEEWKSIRDVFACWSGTMTAYVEPGQKLGKQVEYVDPEKRIRWVFSVPQAHRDKTNAILVAEHPDYILEVDGRNRVVHATELDFVDAFPAKNGWHLVDPKHGIPTGEAVEFSGQARYLWRTAKSVGPVARGYDFRDDVLGDYKQDLFAVCPPSNWFGVAVEATYTPPTK